ncbi:uncharacterized protein LOC104445952 [Eucalyptus grandis]|uniref:uncharacterized protein LOC104445952 n=1 Tax=Eucalyptus grandis TaxID=71139 RepID=UPI00192EADEB|nr:uncharacterized protein LOC104445952 [Eucalyptus grandis]
MTRKGNQDWRVPLGKVQNLSTQDSSSLFGSIPMELANQSPRADVLCGSMVDLDGGPKKASPGAGLLLSDKESRIRGELELDVERDLEEEIKDAIYRLALQLHRLYRHKKERLSRASQSAHCAGTERRGVEEKPISEVNISIKMEGGTKVEITETKREAARDKPRPRPASATPNSNCRIPNSKNGTSVPRGKKFDWARSLRSGGGPGLVDKKGGGDDSRKSRAQSHDRRLARPNPRSVGCRSNVGGGGGSARHKVNRRVDHKLLDMEMGWQS